MSRAIHKMRLGDSRITVVDGSRSSSTADLTVYTFSSQVWAAPGRKRVVVVFITSTDDSGSARVLETVTIDGNSATILVQRRSSTVAQHSAIVAAFVPTGTGGDVVVTFNTAGDTQISCSIQIATLYNVESLAPTFSGNDTVVDTSISVASVTVGEGGIVLGAVTTDANGQTVSWTNLSEKSDANTTDTRSSHAFELQRDFGGPETVTVTNDSGSHRMTLVIASLR